MAQTKIEQGLLKFTESTDYLKIPTGTTAQRPSSAAAGFIRFNTTVGKTEVYDGTSWSQIGVQNPTVTSLDYPGNKTTLDPAGGETLLINGTNFKAGATVTFGGTNATSITLNSATQLSVVAPAKAAGNHDLKITNTDGGTVTVTSVYNALPTWTTNAGSLGSVGEGDSMSFTVAATESDGGAITYAVTSGALPSGGSLNTSTGAITGTAPSVSADTTSNFTITATDNENQTASRAFSITVTNKLPSQSFGVMLYTGDGATGREVNGGKYGGAAYFNGTNAKIDIGNMGLGGNTERTISAWINTDSLSSAQTIYQHGAAANGQRFGFAIDTSGKLYVEYYNRDAITSAAHIAVDTWYHVAVTYNGGAIETATNTQIYVNGSAVSMATSGSQTGNANTADSNYGIGYRRASTSGYFNGKIDQLRIFTRAISSSEVSTLYNETDPASLNPLSETETSVKGATRFYQFNNNTTDTAGNNNGNATGTSYTTDSKFGSHAIDFAGNNNSYVDLDDCGINGDRSFSMWVNFDEFNQNMFLVDSADRQSANHFAGSGVAMYSSGDDALVLQWNTYNGSSYGSGQVARTFQANEWVHLVFAVQADNHKIYVNGVEQPWASTSRYNTRKASPGALRLGDESRASQSGGFDGQMDQVRIYNRWISPGEAMALYNETSLSGFYKFDGNSKDEVLRSNGSDSNMDYEFGLGFKPDFVWIKPRTQADHHNIYDSTRGATKQLAPNSTAAESTQPQTVQSFDTGGFTTNGDNNINNSGIDYVAWCLKANGGTTSSNSDGAITSTVQSNSAAGFAIAKVTGSGSSATFGHGLGSTPEVIVRKNLDASDDWTFYTTVIDGTLDYMKFNTNNGPDPSSYSLPTSTVFTNPGDTNDRIYYSFVSVAGFSKISKYTGNGNANGPIVTTGFEPAFLIIKSLDRADHWFMVDNKRSPLNPRDEALFINLTDTEYSNYAAKVEFYGNGFRVISSDNLINANNEKYLYMAFAEDPDTVVPTKAKSFNTVTWTGTGSNRSITRVGFKPGFLWIKGRNNTEHPYLYDAIRGSSKYLHSTTDGGEVTDTTSRLASFDQDGFSLFTDGAVNGNGSTYVGWAWKMDNDEPVINTDGNTDSIVLVNANAGMSVVSYIGTGSATTIGHGLNSAPEMIIVKNRSGSDDWRVYHTAMGPTKYRNLNDSSAQATSSNIWNDTAPTNTVFSVGSAGSVTEENDHFIAYCFHSVTGFSKFGYWQGGTTTINLGFQPDFVMHQDYGAGGSWSMIDSVRDDDVQLKAQSSDAESSQSLITFTSTGFTATSESSNVYRLYMAFKIN
tara:strand:+ start:3478 stop:7401 length:3924 start_codon:yes stop_codon:yes gene_type:complete